LPRIATDCIPGGQQVGNVPSTFWLMIWDYYPEKRKFSLIPSENLGRSDGMSPHPKKGRGFCGPTSTTSFEVSKTRARVHPTGQGRQNEPFRSKKVGLALSLTAFTQNRR
jgi:hypothetical protein